MSMPPPSRTPTHPIRPAGEVPNSQEDSEGHSSDFEDLLEEAKEGGLTMTLKSASSPADPLPSAPAVRAGPGSEEGAGDMKLLSQLPSIAAHILPVIKSPVSATIGPQSSTAQAPSAAHMRLQARITALQSHIASLTTQISSSNALLPDPTLAPSIVKAHIKLLHSYNEIKDVGLGLMGLIADGRGVRLGGVMEEFGVGERD